MADPIRIRLDRSRYKTPSQEDVEEAKRFILQREEYARILGERVDGLLSDAAAAIVLICYRYGIEPKNLIFSSAFNAEMMDEISKVMDDLSDSIYNIILEYSTRATDDRDHIDALAAWVALLGRGNMNLRDTLDGYLYKTMKDWEAAIAAMRYAGVGQSTAVTRIKASLHSIYSIPEMVNAFKRAEEFASTYIRNRGVLKGAVGLSNNGATNVVNMAKTTLQMAWMREQAVEFHEEGASGYYQLRGSAFPCDVCDGEVGFHKGIAEIYTKPYPHPHCCCYRIPIFALNP